MGLPQARPVEQRTATTANPSIAKDISPKSNYPNAIRTPITLVTGNPNPDKLGDPQVKARYSTHNRIPAIIFKSFDYYRVMEEQCKLIIINKFLRARPQIEKI